MCCGSKESDGFKKSEIVKVSQVARRVLSAMLSGYEQL